jgi:hypothetical protein
MVRIFVILVVQKTLQVAEGAKFNEIINVL